MPNTDTCSRCNVGAEIATHCFYFCSKALRIWRILGFASLGSNTLQGVLGWVCTSCNKNPFLFTAAPIADFVKINCDGSIMPNGHLAGLGCLVRDCHGEWDWGFRRVISETDCLDAFLLLNHGYISPDSDHLDLLHKICAVLHRDWSVRVCLLQPSANTAADLIAKKRRVYNHLLRFGKTLGMIFYGWCNISSL
ncbi:hypothetical protein PIB30_059142 [Stylosanthes scabra]|uniref:RNase H type-1 domain-containing protein n=1 Tax=Stylosanthes scabra TaxID=79078 RepID=A0ABU6WLU7_9FABA|nr:hypothetical protein [Stylosanthes scabra]